MGTWGTSLYADDMTRDVRDVYIEELRNGKTNNEIMQALIRMYKSDSLNQTDMALFWFALADTQWDYGRLASEVKEKALYYLDKDYDLEPWIEAGSEKNLQAWIKTRLKLKEKLLSEQPKVKQIRKRRLYRIRWQLGDLFMYQFHGGYSKEKGYYGKYIVFRYTQEAYGWPGHTIPAVLFFNWIGEKEDIPTIEELKGISILPLCTYFSVYNFNKEPEQNIRNVFLVSIYTAAEKQIPIEYCKKYGSIQGTDLRTLECKEGEKLPIWKPTPATFAFWENKKIPSCELEFLIINAYEHWTPDGELGNEELRRYSDFLKSKMTFLESAATTGNTV